MACINRRRLLKLSGAGAIAAKSGGLAAIWATGRAPAYGQATSVHWLRGSSFVPASDVLIKGEITMECQALGIKLIDETMQPATGGILPRGAADMVRTRDAIPTARGRRWPSSPPDTFATSAKRNAMS